MKQNYKLNKCGFFLRLVRVECNRHGLVNTKNKFRVLLPLFQHGVISIKADGRKRDIAFLPNSMKSKKIIVRGKDL